MEPLASRMRPKSLSEYKGQTAILAPGTLLYRSIAADRVPSMILYGPPGTGKTSLAEVIASTTGADFRRINATTAGKKDMETVVTAALKSNRKTILFIDEIHRFNKAQQDYLLPFVEDGTVVLIGATTENPYFSVNKALVSRCAVFELVPLDTPDILSLLRTAVPFLNAHPEDYPPVSADPDALAYLAEMAAGDARQAYNALELAVLSTPPGPDGTVRINLDTAKNCVQKKSVNYDRDGDSHYDTISAFIKSMRGSDPDAALYYLARMLRAGEDPAFIARRILIHACEDVGLADPLAIVVAEACCSSVERIGMPEARILLSEATLYVAKAKKSNSSAASIDRALKLAEFASDLPIPNYLRDAHYGSAGKLNRGIGYKYPHDYPHSLVEQDYLPEKLKGVEIYRPCENDFPTYGK